MRMSGARCGRDRPFSTVPISRRYGIGVKHKTTYRLNFNNKKLIENCIEAVRDAPPIPKTHLQWRKAGIAIGKAGIKATEREGEENAWLDEADIELPDLLTDLQDRTGLTRRTLYQVLVDSGRLDDFKRNPQRFIEVTAEAINRCKRTVIVDGIKYQRIGDEQYYAQELFEQEELTGYLKNLLPSQKSVYEQVVYDLGGEQEFADRLEKNNAVKVYAKLPGWFTVPTPLGTYNPDWAVLIEKEGLERLYFVVETKGSDFADDLRGTEVAKIKCGRAHFKSLGVGEDAVRYIVTKEFDSLLNV